MDKGHEDPRTISAKRIFGWIGMLCLLFLIPMKAIRLVHSEVGEIIIGIAPSILGPPGLLFLVLSSSGKLSRLTLAQATTLVTIIALALEFAQLLPRPGILSKIQYTFDWLDVASSLGSLIVAFVFATLVLNKLQRDQDKRQVRRQT